MYWIRDVVEVGYYSNNSKGASVEIGFGFKEYSPNVTDRALSVIDKLDHLLITDDAVLTENSERYILLNKLDNLLEDIYIILSDLWQEEESYYGTKLPKKISIKTGKEEIVWKYVYSESLGCTYIIDKQVDDL